MFHDSCIHVAAILDNYYDELINKDKDSITKELTTQIMNEFKEQKSKTIKT